MNRIWYETRKTCLAFSPGGHLAELERATANIHFADAFEVTFDSARLHRSPDRPVFRIAHPRRRIWRTFVNTFQSLKILLKERPELIISTGADVTVPIMILGRLVGAKLIFIESGGTVGPTLTGRLIYPFAQTFIVQWPAQQAHYPKARLASAPLL